MTDGKLQELENYDKNKIDKNDFSSYQIRQSFLLDVFFTYYTFELYQIVL